MGTDLPVGNQVILYYQIQLIEGSDMLDVSRYPVDIYYSYDTINIPVPLTAWGFFCAPLRDYEGRMEENYK